MRFQRPASVLLLEAVLLGALVIGVHANPPPPEPPAEAIPSIFAQSPLSDAARPAGPPGALRTAQSSSTRSPSPRTRALSPTMASKIAVFVKSDAEARGLGSVTQLPPASGGASDAIALERYTVWEGRLPAFAERDILTDKGKLALAKRRYPGADGASALALLRADFDAERRVELADYKNLLKVGGAELSPEMKRLIDGTVVPPTSPPGGVPLRSLLQK